MSLKVTKILHIEKSFHQDILVFESETYGNVLVLDGVLQCTERDEISYQEMITHLPLATHPNPKRVLVIGGGDGGVVREVLRHETVEHVVLCDIDAAVIRVSKIYSPHMSALLASPKVTVHVGDGFEFPPQNEAVYDVIITDSSDLVGPAECLFQESYFQLLFDALNPSGHISTQAETLWLDLPLIERLRNMTRSIFPVSEYAYATVPTYPSGQIGFIICSKDSGRDLKAPVREVKGTKYYNKALHTASFILLDFGQCLLQESRDTRPKLGRDLVNDKSKKKILLLGSGLVARPCAEYIVRDPSNHLTIACRSLESAQSLAAGLPSTSTVSLDATDPLQLKAAVAAHHLG